MPARVCRDGRSRGRTEFDVMALRQLLQGRRRGRQAHAGEVPEKEFDPRRSHPGDLEQSGARIPQGIPSSTGHVEHDSGSDRHAALIEGDASLPLMDEERQVLIPMPAVLDGRAGQERLGPRGKRRGGHAWINPDRDLPGSRRAQLQDFPGLFARMHLSIIASPTGPGKMFPG